MKRCASGLFLLALVAGCVTQWASTNPSPPPAPPDGPPEERPREKNPLTEGKPIARTPEQSINAADIATAVDDNTRFALDLYARLRTRRGNLFFSPYSISTALAMTRAGARGTTAAQMDKVLHFTLAQDRLHPAFADLIRRINGRKGCELSTANALWGQKGAGFKADFLDLVKRNYGAGLKQVDFIQAPGDACRQVNDWVSKETHGKIRDILKDLSPRTRLVLANAIYFKAAWDKPFVTSQTKEELFHLSGGATVKAPLMNQTDTFGYHDAGTVQVLEMPYAGHTMGLVILLPKRKNGLAVLESDLTVGKLAAWLSGLRETNVSVKIPKFKFEQTTQLKKTLAEMGMPQAFTEKADFTGMYSGKEPLEINSVIHKAFVETKEEGTEAAAATAVTITSGSAPLWATPKTRVFRADHPFVFLIRDRATGSILFMGRVSDPTK